MPPIKDNSEICNMYQKKLHLMILELEIISVPSAILNNIKDNSSKKKVDILINNKDKGKLTFVPGRNYLSSVTPIFKKYGFIKDDGATVKKP